MDLKNNIFTRELSKLKPDDEIQFMEFNIKDHGYGFINTAGHGYLVIPKSDYMFTKAKNIAKFGYIGNEAVYLEEDCEAPEFLSLLEPS